MKLAKSVQLLAVALALASTVVGCRKGLNGTTSIPGQRAGSIVDSNPNPIRDLQPTTPVPPFNPNNPRNTDVTSTTPQFDPTKDGNIAQATDDISNWPQNRSEFAAQTVYFDFDKSNIKPGEVGKLEEVAKRMKENFKGKKLLIEGHCDERGTEEYNRSLGDRRALSVREKLVQLGLGAADVHTITFGEEKPLDPGHNDAAWSKNRRGELILLSPPGSN